MKNFMRHVFTLLLSLPLLAGCEKDEPGNAPSVSVAKKVSGKVTDTRGNALSGAKVIAEHTVWFDSYALANSDMAGNYSINIPVDPQGSWTAKAQLTKSAYGRDYKFDLDVNNATPFNASANVVRNFTWKLNGTRPGNAGYYGAHVDLYQFGSSVPMEDVRLMFTPFPGENTLIDGSPCLSFERAVENIAGTYMVKDIPIGKYMVKAMYPGRTLLLDYRHSSGNPQVNKEVVFGKYGFLGETEYNIEFWLSE